MQAWARLSLVSRTFRDALTGAVPPTGTCSRTVSRHKAVLRKLQTCREILKAVSVHHLSSVSGLLLGEALAEKYPCTCLP